MKGCLLLLVGVVAGAILLAAFQVFLSPSPTLSEASSDSPDVVITFTNDFLTRELRRQAASIQTPVPLEGLQVQTDNTGDLVITGDLRATGTGITAPARVTLHPVVVQNRVQVQVVKMDVGALTIPGQYFRGIESPINDELNRSLANSPYDIQRVSTTTDGLKVDVVIKQQ